MKRSARTAAVLCLLGPALSWAAPSVELISPAPGACLSAGRPAQPSQAGVEPPFLPADIVVEAQVAESAGAPVTLVLRVDGVEVLREVHVPTLPGVAEVIALRLGAQLVDDGLARVFRVEAETLDGADADEATAEVDRRPPAVSFNPADLARVDTCVVAEPAAPAFTVDDALDASPASAGVWRTQGCQLRYEVTASDHCGAMPNTALVTYGVLRAPPAPPAIAFDGVGEGEVTLRAVVDYTVTAGEGCVESVDATLQRGQEPAGGLVDGAIVADPGQYTATVTVDPVCTEQTTSAQRHFTVVQGARADAGGPYQTAQGVAVTLDASGSVAPPQAGGITAYDWDLDNDSFYDLPNAGPQVPFMRRNQGTYQVWVRITTGNGEHFFDDATVTVADPTPTCDAGGPYVIEQGTSVTFDATATRAGAADEPILAYGWDFGDDRFPQQGDGLTQPSHRYASEGTYTVTLTVQDIDSVCIDTATVEVHDIQPEIRNLHVVRDAVPEGELLQVSAGQTSAGSAAEPLIDFSWTWGDGGPAEVGVELRSPSHTYPDSGVYQVCLAVRDVDSRISECMDVTVTDLEPLAFLAGPGFALEGEEVTFDAEGSRAGGAADLLTGLSWDFGDATPAEERAPDQTRIQHTFTEAGTLTVRLTVTDEDSAAEATQDIIVEDAEPLADLVAPARGVEGLEVRFDASGSIGGAASDPITSYEWDFGDGETADGPELATVGHAYPDDGLYLVAVTVVDADGSRARRDTVVRIENAAPTDVRIVRTSVGTPEVGRPVTFTVEYTDVDADSPRATWSFGDGGRVDGPVDAEHTFEAPGRYRVVVSVDDGDEGVATAELSVQVERPGPEITGPTEGVVAEGETYTAQIDVRPAPDGAGGYDAPVTVRVPLLPPGASVQIVDVGARPTVRRVLLRFSPGFAQEGAHAVHIDARSPSGLNRAHDLTVEVTDVATPVLLGSQALSGTQGEVTVFAWRREPVSRATIFERLGRTALGEPPGDLLAGSEGHYGFVGLAQSARIAVVDLATGSVVRRIPVPGDGRSPTLFSAGGATWALTAGNTLSRIDETRLKVGRTRVLPAPERLVHFEVVGDPVNGDLVALGSTGTSLYLWVLADVVAERAGPPRRLVLPFRASTMAWDAGGERLLLADAKAPRLHDLAGDPLVASPPVLDDAAVELPGLATRILTGGDDTAPWIVTRGGLVRLTRDEVSLYASRFWSGAAFLPATLLGEESLALGTSSAIEIQRVADAASLEVWRGNGASRLLVTLRR